MECDMKDFVRKHQLVTFFVLSYALAYLAMFGHVYLKPGQPLPPFSVSWFIFVFSPTISAVFCAWAIGGWAEVKKLLSGFTRWKVGLGWYLAALFLILGPLAISLVYIAMGNPAAGLSAGSTILMLIGQAGFQLLSGPASEEAGWRGFALPRLESRHNALVSSLILGVIWTFWHLPLSYVPGQAQATIPIPIYLLLIVTVTIYITWLYNNTRGSLIITTLAHFSYNLTGLVIYGMVTLMPAMTFYMTAGPLLFLVVVGVVVYFKPKYLSRKPVSELPFEIA
jgi:membrane protease YdiL (CAAX protease family)